MPTLISPTKPARPNATIEFTAEEMDLLLFVCQRIGGKNTPGDPHYFFEHELQPLLIDAGARHEDFPLEKNMTSKNNIYFAI
jgi:hypothetical protein